MDVVVDLSDFCWWVAKFGMDERFCCRYCDGCVVDADDDASIPPIVQS